MRPLMLRPETCYGFGIFLENGVQQRFRIPNFKFWCGYFRQATDRGGDRSDGRQSLRSIDNESLEDIDVLF
jgi:hypothetical protein